MAGTFENLYLRMPVWAQNCALSIKGFHERRIRFGDDYRQFTHQVAARRHLSGERLLEFQLAALNQLVSAVAQHVPFYRELYRRRTARDDLRLSSLEDLTMLPIIDKETLRERNTDFLNPRIRSRDLIRLKTTGTTGIPVTVFTTARARQLNYAYYNDFLASVGLDPFGKRVVIGGRMIMSGAHGQAPYWRFSRSMNTMYLSSYHISPATMPAYAKAMNEWGAEYIDGYPSSIWALARLLRDSSLAVEPPRAVITSSETLYPEQRELLQDVFGSPVYDQYGAREMCMFAAQCRSGRYHARSDYGIIEIDKDGRPAPPGEPGRVLCTGFVNPAMPLIRYEIGDAAAWAADQDCDCGFAGRVLERIVGRQDDTILCPDGRRIGRLSPLMLKRFPVREAQYIQRELGAVIVRLVKEPSYSERDTVAIRAELQKLLGKDMAIDFEFVEAIPRGRGGKLRAVISEIGHQARLHES